MFRKLVKRDELVIEGQRCALHYYVEQTSRGSRRYSCEVQLDGTDRIILDDDTMTSLESKVRRLAPATVYSRLLARVRTEAA
jgi:hypothetical protein